MKCREKEIIPLAIMALTFTMASTENLQTTINAGSTTSQEAKIDLKLERNPARTKNSQAKQTSTYGTNANCASVSDFWLTLV